MKADKLKHIAVGTFFGVLVPVFGPWAVLACLAAAFLKEAYDLTGRGTPEWADILATVVPTIFFFFLQIIFGG